MNPPHVRLLEYFAELDVADSPSTKQSPSMKVIAQFSSLRIDMPPGTPAFLASRIARTAANAVRAIGHRFIETDVVNYEGEIYIIISHLNPRMSRAQAVEVAQKALQQLEFEKH